MSVKMVFATLSDFKKAFSIYYPLDTCKCGGCNELSISSAEVEIGNQKLIVSDCPVLVCDKCGRELLGHRVPKFLYKAYSDIPNKDELGYCNVRLKGERRFQYASKADFVYDSRDLNIPGCDVTDDPTQKDGFSLPVFFDRKVLNNFYLDDEYVLDFFSESYGNIGKKSCDSEYDFEWIIPFGVNSNDKVVMFLGDLDLITDARSLLWLKSYNTPSDHLLVKTEFYRAQLKAIFSEPIMEERIIGLRKGFYRKVEKEFGVSLYHLEEEAIKQAHKITKPIVFSEIEITNNIIALDGVLNEAISLPALRQLAQELNIQKTNLGELRTRKLLQEIIASKEGEAVARTIIAPLFYLNDLRVIFAHLLSQKEEEEMIKRILDALDVASFSDYRKVYEKLLAGLYDLYKYLLITDFEIVEE